MRECGRDSFFGGNSSSDGGVGRGFGDEGRLMGTGSEMIETTCGGGGSDEGELVDRTRGDAENQRLGDASWPNVAEVGVLFIGGRENATLARFGVGGVIGVGGSATSSFFSSIASSFPR